MKELGGKQPVLRLAAQLVDVMDIIKEVSERDNTLSFVFAQIEVVDMVGEERFIKIQIANSSEFVFEDQLTGRIPPSFSRHIERCNQYRW